MPRGGLRQGAGRPAVFTLDENLDTGEACVVLYAKALDRLAIRAHEERHPDMAELWRDINSIPVRDRAAFIASQAYQDHKDDVEFARRTRAKMDDADDHDAPRLVDLPLKRPQMLKAAVRYVVRCARSQTLGRTLTDGHTRTCWQLVERVRSADV